MDMPLQADAVELALPGHQRRPLQGGWRERSEAWGYNPPRRASPHGEAANRVRWGTKQP